MTYEELAKKLQNENTQLLGRIEKLNSENAKLLQQLKHLKPVFLRIGQFHIREDSIEVIEDAIGDKDGYTCKVNGRWVLPIASCDLANMIGTVVHPCIGNDASERDQGAATPLPSPKPKPPVASR